MQHFHYTIPGWFTFPTLYSFMVQHYNTGKFVEVGSFQGNSAAFMGVEIANSGKNIKLDCIDTWDKFAIGGLHLKEPDNYPDDLVYQLFIKNTEPVRDWVTPVRMNSIEAAKLYPDNSLEFVFIDANHEYEAVLADLKAWYPKVRKGGHMAGHDYVSDERVMKAVNEFFNGSFDGKENCWCHFIQ